MPLAGHHSISAEFDMGKQVTLSGIVTHVDWMNPHSYFFLDVVQPKRSKTENWAFQLGSMNSIRALGWTRDTLKIGDQLTVSGSPAWSGARSVYTREIVFADGRRLNAEFPPAKPLR